MKEEHHNNGDDVVNASDKDIFMNNSERALAGGGASHKGKKRSCTREKERVTQAGLSVVLAVDIVMTCRRGCGAWCNAPISRMS